MILRENYTGPAFGQRDWTPWRWLESTRELQARSFGKDPHDLEGEERNDFILWNVLAAHTELSEFLCEVGWKPWGKDRTWLHREKALEELVDVGHFLANLLSAMRVTDEEWEAAYKAKQQVNRERMASGTYTGNKRLDENDEDEGPDGTGQQEAQHQP